MNTKSTESKTDSMPVPTLTTSTGYEGDKTKTDDKTPPADVVDDFGYKTDDKTVDDKTPPADDKKPDDVKKDEEKVKVPSTGYTDDKDKTVDDKTQDKPDDKKKTEETDEEKIVKELTETVKDLPEEVNKDKVLKFAQDNKMSKEQLKAYTDMVKAELADSKVAREEFIKTQRSEWQKELKSDPVFGGENFIKNVDRVEKLLENNMPNLKKHLTTTGGMLPPYIMHDLLAISKALNPVTDFVQGSAGDTSEGQGNFLEEMYK